MFTLVLSAGTGILEVGNGEVSAKWAPGNYNRIIALPYVQQEFPEFRLLYNQFHGTIDIE